MAKKVFKGTKNKSKKKILSVDATQHEKLDLIIELLRGGK